VVGYIPRWFTCLVVSDWAWTVLGLCVGRFDLHVGRFGHPIRPVFNIRVGRFGHFTYPRRDGQAELAWVAWLNTNGQSVTHVSTKPAQRRVTSLM